MDSRVAPIVQQIGSVLLGKQDQIVLALSCLFAGGHLLIEDLPGMGKTLLSQALAQALGLDFKRVQFTSDLLPADILGSAIFNRHEGTFTFQRGPIFTQVLMADEINRTTPKTQSALLEAMEERQVTADGNQLPLPEPFFVIATQNPAFQTGTYPLPESQLDRFLMRIEIGYPEPEAEVALLKGQDPREVLASMTPVLNAAGLAALRADVAKVHASDALLSYIYRLVRHSRETPEQHGLSPRGAMALIRAARAFALVTGRDHVLPEDVQTVLAPVVEHRLRGAHGGSGAVNTRARELMSAVDVVG